MENIMDKKGLISSLLLLIALFLHFSNLHGLSIYALDEAKNATAAIEMLQQREWVVPTFNGEYRFDKPPLHYYFFILAYQLFGINEFAARFFPALFGFLTVYFTYRFARKNLGYRAGILTLLVLTSSLHWYIQFHMAVPDPFLIFFMTMAFMAFYEWSLSGFRSTMLMLVTYASLGLAVLSKGPVGVLLPCIAFLVYGLVMQLLNGKRLQRIFHPMGLAVFFLIALPWYVLVATKTNGLWIEEFIFKHNLNRFSAPMEGHGGGFWLTWLFVLGGMLPFAFFLLQGIWHTLKFRTNRVTTFSLISATTIIVFFMLAGTKLPNYTVPAYPFLAIIIGNYLNDMTIKKQWKPLLVPAVLIAMLLIALPFGIYFGLSADRSLTVSWSMLWLFFIPTMAVPLMIMALYKKRAEAFVFYYGGSFMLVALIFFWLAFPKIDRQNPVLAAKTYALSANNWYYFKIYNPAFSFYLRQPLENIQEVGTPKHASGYLITRKTHLKELEMLGIRYKKVFEGKDLFESPTTVILQLTPKEQAFR
ncbi:glycosyltransferase family 39 protein [Echinicola strongylocentroti]|uniref:Glycosyltransferase family 39 protein n=1 Tax=Echinicola strongylocentroti TaxID=1795355 RepID=A0A2Z4IIP1_9BACT|nr:glycosyltransferase family 39 protein [Echinicola strongylocentroti]AWW30587.1 glycosyltransferase family 39 protein [Echinicola strongylocentroti]